MEHMLGFTVIVIRYAAIGFMAVAGAIFIARKFLAPKAEQIFFPMFLIMIAAFYLGFAAYFGAATAWQMETAAVLAFAAIGLVGMRLPLALIIGYSMHANSKSANSRRLSPQPSRGAWPSPLRGSQPNSSRRW
jgi:hypothetical protein